MKIGAHKKLEAYILIGDKLNIVPDTIRPRNKNISYHRRYKPKQSLKSDGSTLTTQRFSCRQP